MQGSIFHRYINHKIKTVNLNSNIVKLRKVRKILYQHRIPLALQTKFLAEMEELGFIKTKDKQNIIVNR